MAYADPRPGLPLSPLMQRALGKAAAPVAKPDVTEIRKAVTIIQDVTKKRGRPKTGHAKTDAERKRAQRAKKNG